ncbi:DUF3987 domain-containing protein, partial [Vibrio sp. 10N.222.54.F6]
IKKFFKNENSNKKIDKKNTNKKIECENDEIINEESKEPSLESVPKLAPEALHGVIGKAVNVFCNSTEALVVALSVEILCYLSVCIPRGNAYLQFGATTTEPRVNGIVVAATGEGKGISTRQFECVRKRMAELDASLVCPVFEGGLSTPEGLISLIRDENNTEDDKNISASVGNQLLVIEEEMSSIFNLANNARSNFSPLFRELFDGKPVSPLTKFNKISCDKPHVSFFGHITQQELHLVVKKVDIYNGFLNRFPLFFAKRENSIPFPYKIPYSNIDMIANDLMGIISWVKEEEHEMEYSTCYKVLWEIEYEKLRSLGKQDSIERALLSRATHYATMYSIIFAVMDKSTVIKSVHLKAALAWIDYWHQSLTHIYRTESKRAKYAELEEKGRKVMDVIVREIQASEQDNIGKTPLTKAFSGKFSSRDISEILEYLQSKPNPKIKVDKLPRNALKISLC